MTTFRILAEWQKIYNGKSSLTPEKNEKVLKKDLDRKIVM